MCSFVSSLFLSLVRYFCISFIMYGFRSFVRDFVLSMCIVSYFFVSLALFVLSCFFSLSSMSFFRP